MDLHEASYTLWPSSKPSEDLQDIVNAYCYTTTQALHASNIFVVVVKQQSEFVAGFQQVLLGLRLGTDRCLTNDSIIRKQ